MPTGITVAVRGAVRAVVAPSGPKLTTRRATAVAEKRAASTYMRPLTASGSTVVVSQHHSLQVGWPVAGQAGWGKVGRMCSRCAGQYLTVDARCIVHPICTTEMSAAMTLQRQRIVNIAFTCPKRIRTVSVPYMPNAAASMPK